MSKEHDQDRSGPTAAQVAVGTSHCGAGCMLADVACEFWIAAAGITLLGSALWAEYTIDFAAAWAGNRLPVFLDSADAAFAGGSGAGSGHQGGHAIDSGVSDRDVCVDGAGVLSAVSASAFNAV